MKKTKAIKALGEVHDDMQVVTERVEAAYDEAQYVCKTRCWDCCSSYFKVTLTEALRMWEGFKLLPSGVRAGVLEDAQVAREKLESADGEALDRWLDQPLGMSRAHEGEAEARDEKFFVQCPLLDGEGFCRVYDHRPLTCHAFGQPRKGAAGGQDWCYKNLRHLAEGERVPDDQVIDYQEVVGRRDAIDRAFYEDVLGREPGFLFKARLAEWLLMDLDRADWKPLLEQVTAPSAGAIEFIRHICPREVFERLQVDASLFEEIAAWHASVRYDTAVMSHLDAVFDQLEDWLETGATPQYALIRRVIEKRGPQFLGYVVLNIGQRYLSSSQ